MDILMKNLTIEEVQNSFGVDSKCSCCNILFRKQNSIITGLNRAFYYSDQVYEMLSRLLEEIVGVGYPKDELASTFLENLSQRYSVFPSTYLCFNCYFSINRARGLMFERHPENRFLAETIPISPEQLRSMLIIRENPCEVNSVNVFKAIDFWNSFYEEHAVRVNELIERVDFFFSVYHPSGAVV